MRRLLICGAAALALAGAASAGTLEALKGNTLVVTGAAGETAYIVKADGEAEVTRSSGFWAAGFWRTPNGPDQICFTMRGEATTCFPLAADKAVGDEWELKGPTGQVSFTLKIAEGEVKLEKPAAGDGQ